jgi:hypothetical protein
MNMILLAAFFCSFLAGSLLLVFRKLAADRGPLLVEDDWFEQLSPDRYRPLERLLDAREYHTLRAHPAFNSRMLRNFRNRRVAAFRGYLSALSLDYGRVCRTARALLAASAQDRPDLAGLLVRQRFTFTLRMILVQGRLSLHAWGVGTVDVGELVSSLASMRLQLNTLIEAAQPAGA